MSGGLDSAVCAAYAKEHYSTVHALTVSYGQRNPREIGSAFNIATALKLQVHEPIQTAYKVLVGSSLIEFDKIPQYESMDDFKKCQEERREKGDDKPDPTFVPGRNPFFFNIAVNRAYKLKITDILIGTGAITTRGISTRGRGISFNAITTRAITTRGISTRAINTRAINTRGLKMSLLKSSRLDFSNA
jgi:7-cyano-7-deazaguanine synthase